MICIHCGQTIPDGVACCPLCKMETEADARSFYQPGEAPIPHPEEQQTDGRQTGERQAEELAAQTEETEPDLEELLSARIRQLRDYITNLWKRGTETDGR